MVACTMPLRSEKRKSTWKICATEWLLLNTVDELKAVNNRLQMINHQLETKCGNPKISLAVFQRLSAARGQTELKAKHRT